MSDQIPPSPAPNPGWAPVPPKHPDSTTVLVLGILGIALCQFLGPFAWYKGNKVLADMQANPGKWSGESEVNLGRILGIVGTALLGLLAAIIFLYGFAFVLIVIAAITETGGTAI